MSINSKLVTTSLSQEQDQSCKCASKSL